MGSDVYSYGMVSSSRLYVLREVFPAPDCYAEIQDSYFMLGGEAANSSFVLGKLGVNVQIDGNWLGAEGDGRHAKQLLDQCGVNTSRLTMKDNYTGPSEVVFSDKLSRTIFGTYIKLNETENWNAPDEDSIRVAKVVCLDPFFKKESILAAEICSRLAVPYVTVDCEFTSPIAQNAEVLIISGEFRNSKYPDKAADALFLEYSSACKGLVIFTFGEDGVMYSRDGELHRTMAYPVNAVDTAGAGDSFRSGMIYGLLRRWPDEQTIEFAAALSAMICGSFPGVLNCPSYEDILQFIADNRPELSSLFR